MFRFFDPHYKRDRDHKKIVADNRRYEQRMKELKEGLRWIALNRNLTTDHRPPQKIFAALRAAEHRTQKALESSNKLRMRSKKITPIGAKKRKQHCRTRRFSENNGKEFYGAASAAEEKTLLLQPSPTSRSALEIILEVQIINIKIENLGAQFTNEGLSLSLRR